MEKMLKFKSRSVPVKAVQFNSKDGNEYVDVDTLAYDWEVYNLRDEYGGTDVQDGDWIVEFPNKEIHVVTDENFKLRFEEVEEYTKKELSYASLLAASCDCV